MGCTSSHVLPTFQYASLLPDTAAKGYEKELVFTPNDKVKTMRDNYEYVWRWLET